MIRDIISNLREVLGNPTFWAQMQTNNNQGYTWQWDYGAMLEYAVAGILLCITVASVFKFLRCLLK